ncbi:D-alanyl-D-alanine carboxypeptidase DacC [invertebrate metagenome]|uniref:serine-type D-Ala-D-Ala carboxypeptidase n=1 Tax=invertebrate metagenome TaxID=1711999 RepID=A0A2H9TBA4_9ZZZZ
MFAVRRRFAGLMLMLCLAGTQVQAKVAALIPSPPSIGVESYVLVDADSGKVLAAKNPDETLHPASLTKMMTAYIAESELAAGNINRDSKVRVSEKAWSIGGSTMFLDVGDRVSVEELLRGIIIVSGNDACVAVAEHIAGTEGAFAQIMNNMAKKLTLNNTHFVNASGWPANDHYSTARDLALLSKHIIQDFPDYYGIYSEKYYQYGINKQTGKPLARQPNRNRLLWSNPYVDGLKTGHTEATGYHLAATAERDGRRLITVLLGAKSEKQRADEAQALLTYGFRFFENVSVEKGNKPLRTEKVWKGDSSELTVGIANDLIVTVPRGTSKQVKVIMAVQKNLEAPIEKGQQVGILKVMLDDEDLQEVPLIAQQSVEKGGFFKRLLDSILLFFHGLFN